MRIPNSITAAILPPAAPPANAAGSAGGAARVVEPQRTRTSMVEMRAAIGRAYQSLSGREPTKPMLDTLTAQAALETGRGEQMFNYNFGGIKGSSPTGETARYKTREVVDGKDVHIVDGFRAYRSLDDGAKDFVSLLARRYGGALEHADRGDVTGYASSLRASGYYTAPASEYASGLTRIVGELGGSSSSGSGLASSALASNTDARPKITSLDALPTVASIGRFMDALSVPFARLAAPLDDEDTA